MRNAVLFTLALVGSLVGGCASAPVPPPVTFESAPVDSIFVAAPLDSLPALVLSETPTEETLLDKLLRERQELRLLDELYVTATSQWLEGQREDAEATLYSLQSEIEDARLAEPDSFSLLYLGSLDRRVIGLLKILGEERFFQESYAPLDQDLAVAYDSLRVHYGLPAFLESEAEPSTFEQQLLAVDNEAVQKWVDRFTGRGRRDFQRWLDRKARFGPVITQILIEEGLPAELVYLSMIESGLQAGVRSPASAVGWWQFVRSTARTRGLTVNDWVDERRDIEKATRAAARHLKMMYGMFQDWPLALAAYNSGEYRIQRAIGMQGDPDYWTMRLPRETRDYVPKFIAAVKVGESAAEQGFSVATEETLRYDHIELDDTFSLDQVSKAGGFSLSELTALNPQLIASCTPPEVESYRLRVPEGRGEATAAALREIPESERITWRKHRVRRGETLGALARNYRTSVSAIMQLNGIRDPRRVREGRVLTIPYPRGTSSTSPPRVASTTPSNAPAPEGYRSVAYRVRSGDTLIGIARAHGTTVSAIRRANGIRGNRIVAGKELVLHLPKGYVAPQTSVPVSETTHEKTEYEVRRGDTLFGIGQRFGVDVAALLEWNRLDPDKPLHPGDRLVVWRPRSR